LYRLSRARCGGQRNKGKRGSVGIKSRYFIRLLASSFVALILTGHWTARAGQSDLATLQNASEAIANQDYTAAFDDYLKALIANPSQPSTIDSCMTLLTQNPPQKVHLATLAQLNTALMPFDVVYENTEAGTSRSDYRTVFIVPRNALAQDEQDPVDDWPFSRAIYVFRGTDERTANLICTVHYQSDEFAGLAHHIGAFLALLDDVYTQKMMASRADDGYPFNVWLCSTAPVSNGGEQWRNNIYFYDIGDDRSSIEWIREIAHEFSHLAFRPLGGDYTYPEAFANGYLGERLLVRWLWRGAAGGSKSVVATWGRTFEGYPNFARLLIDPAVKEFTSHGLDKTELARRDAVGMRYMIGMMLYIDDSCGSAEVGTVLQNIADRHTSNPNMLYSSAKDALEKSSKKMAQGLVTLHRDQ
jgi:hypothetical protein